MIRNTQEFARYITNYIIRCLTSITLNLINFYVLIRPSASHENWQNKRQIRINIFDQALAIVSNHYTSLEIIFLDNTVI